MGDLLETLLEKLSREEEPTAVTVRRRLPFTHDDYIELSRRYRDLHFERNAEGELQIMSPTGGDTGDRNFELTRQLGNWTRDDAQGRGFDSSTGFQLPSGTDRSPDAAWVRKDRLRQLTDEQRKRFLPLCPDFVVELRSENDSLRELQDKMDEYLQNGALLGWLIDPQTRRVHIYRPGQPVEIQENPAMVSGDPELPGFVLDLAEIWQPSL